MKIVVVGAGAAGLMAAANIDAPVTVLESTEKAGKKIYITGKGRCNLTNAVTADGIIKNIINGDKFMLGAVGRFPPAFVMDFFEGQGLKLKTERGGRVFPLSDHASDVTKTLVNAVLAKGSQFVFDCKVEFVKTEEGGGFWLFAENGERYFADILVLACGGKSYPSTGSDGSAFALLKALGHQVSPLYPSLVPLVFSQTNPKLSGLTFKSVKAKITTKPCENGEKSKEYQAEGEILFTHTGVSGPVILTLSALAAREQMHSVSIDFWVSTSLDEVDKKLISLLNAHSSKAIKTILGEILPKSLAEHILSYCALDPDKKAAEISKKARLSIANSIKNMTFLLDGTGGFGQAVTTSGGAALTEFNPSTMQSKLHKNLYVVGEMLDIDALTGGFNLQLAFSTALAAAQNINKTLDFF